MAGRDDDFLADRLLDLDERDPDSRRRFGAALHSQIEGHLSELGYGRYAAVGLAGMLGALVCGSLAITEPETLARPVRGVLALLAFVGLAWTLFAAWGLARRRGDYIRQRTIAARLAFGLTLAVVIALAAVSTATGRPASGMPLVATGMALLILAGVLLIDGRIEQSELAIREHLLRIEIRLDALTKGIGPSRDDPGDEA